MLVLMMIRRFLAAVLLPLARLLAAPLLIIAVLALVADGTRIVSGAGVAFTTTLDYWTRMAPQSLAGAKAATLKASHAAIWDYGVQSVLRLPAFALFGSIGCLLAFAGRRRRKVNIFAN